MLSNNLVPDHIGDATEKGIPTRTVIILGGIISIFTVIGSLEDITSFTSLKFIIIFGAISLSSIQTARSSRCR